MQPLLFLTVGLPGSGKTTRARELETQHNAVRLTKDEWVVRLLGDDSDRERADVMSPLVEHELWQLALRLLDLGNNVVVDYGLWAIEERKAFRQQGEAHGAKVYFVACEEPFDILWERVSSREESQSGTLHIPLEDMKEWAERFQPLTDEEKQYAYHDGDPWTSSG